MGIAGDLILITVTALLGGVIATRLKLPALLGYIAAGVALGPNTIGPTVEKLEDIEMMADIGVALLLFAVGLEFPIARLAAVRNVALFGTLLQMSLTALVGILAARVIGWDPIPALWFGCLVSVSSTMVVLKFLNDRGLSDTLSARIMTAMLIVQDLAVIPMMILLPAAGKLEEGLSALTLALLRSTLFVGAMLVFGRKLLPWLMARVAGWQSRELFTVTVMAIGLGIGYATWLTGLSLAFGAFLAGVVLTESEYSHQALGEIIPFRDLFAMIFFVSVGMLIHPAFLWEQAATILTLLALVMLSKAVIFAGIARGFGYGNIVPLAVGLGLSQVGEFSIVLARLGFEEGALPEPAYLTLLSVSILSMALTPFLARLAGPIYRRRRAHSQDEPLNDKSPPSEPLQGHVIITGFGRVGRFLAQLLQGLGREVVIIDQNPQRVAEARGAGFLTLGGDMASEHVLEGAGVSHADLVLLTAPEAVASLAAAAQIRRLNPKVRILARAVSLEHLQDLSRAGVSDAAVPELEVGLELMHRSLLHLGLEIQEVVEYEASVRARQYRPLTSGSIEDEALSTLRRSARQFAVCWQRLPEQSPLSGRSLGESRVVEETGATVLGIVRGEGLIVNPGPDLRFEGGDVLGVAGTLEQRQAFLRRVRADAQGLSGEATALGSLEPPLETAPAP